MDQALFTWGRAPQTWRTVIRANRLFTVLVCLGLASLFISDVAGAERGQRINPNTPGYSPRKAAKQYAQRRYAGQGRVKIARRPLLDTRGVNPLKAYGVSVNGRRLKEAVLVRGGFAGYTAQGIADVHYVKPRAGGANKHLGSTGNSSIIVRTKGRSSTIEAQSNLTKVGEGYARGVKSAALNVQWPLRPPVIRPPLPPVRPPRPPVIEPLPIHPFPVQPMVYPGPSGNARGTAVVSNGSKQATVTKDFHRMVIMAGR